MLKKLSVFIILFILLSSVFSQVTSVNASHNPITGPLTSPITSPISSANLMGKVVHRQLGRLFSNAHRLFPVQGVVVTVQNFFNSSQRFTATTDSNGVYALNVPQGLYKVSVDDSHNTFYAPPLKVVRVKNPVKNANFQGLLFPQLGR